MPTELYERKVTVTFTLHAWLTNVSMEQVEALMPTQGELIDHLANGLDEEWFTSKRGADWWVESMEGRSSTNPKAIGEAVRVSYTVNADVVAETTDADGLNHQAELFRRRVHTAVEQVTEPFLEVRKLDVHRNW